MDREQIIKFIHNRVESVKDFFNRMKQAIINTFQKINELHEGKERPKNVTNVQDYLDKKKKSEPFYKAVNGNKKPWE